ncbi:MSC_0621 family F1-like ATPase epsilon subunit [Metamycoplasma auris]|uniref:Uncharacterized protein n=1 Tax=Metamycoplasma auris TaxID=51363 RepID=A0A2W7G8V2_9BACT|nr:hypothetical protein [Metamycoplasma auris]PZW01475.1 hypothetical protein BCF89_102102 [Metamycoplasma auris]
MENKSGSFNIKINFIDSKVLEIKKAKLYINVDEDDDWILIDSNSIMAYEYVMIKINDLDEDKTFYLFLLNPNIVIKDNRITINTFSKKVIYKQTKEKIDKKDEIKEVLKKIEYYQSLQILGLNLDQFMELKILKQKLALLNLEQKFRLVK